MCLVGAAQQRDGAGRCLGRMATVGLAISPATPTPARSHEHESPGAGDAGILSSWKSVCY
jgi:hypothetical protein